MKFFKRTTMGKPCIMGRKTYDSLPTALKGRHNIVLSRSHSLLKLSRFHNTINLDDGVVDDTPLTLAKTKKAALKVAGDVPEICVIGGAEIYQLFKDETTDILVTGIPGEYKADTVFPFYLSEEFEPHSYETLPGRAGLVVYHWKRREQ